VIQEDGRRGGRSNFKFSVRLLVSFTYLKMLSYGDNGCIFANCRKLHLPTKLLDFKGGRVLFVFIFGLAEGYGVQRIA
jgi:hypothetical protein